jgi:hypothetical protein
MAGYSGTPLAKKLGIKEGCRLLAVGAPPDYHSLLQPLPPSVRWAARAGPSVDIVHLFTVRRSELSAALAAYRKTLGPQATVWVSWPKQKSKLPTDVTEDTVREVALPLGFVDVKVCAVDDVWSGLKLVVRKELR